MSEELQKHLTTWLESIERGAAQVGDLFSDQAPLFVRDVIALGRAESAFYFLLGLILFAVASRLGLRLLAKSCEQAGDDAKSAYIGVGVGCLAIGVVVGLGLLSLGHAHDLLASWFAPRVYLLERLAALIGKGRP